MRHQVIEMTLFMSIAAVDWAEMFSPRGFARALDLKSESSGHCALLALAPSG